MKKIVFMAPLPAFRKRTRLIKMASVLLERGHTLSLFGWEREPGELDRLAHPDPSVSERIILRGGGYASSKARLYYPLWMLMVFWRVLLLGRDQTIFALGWETAFPVCLAAKITRATVVFDDADRFSMIIKLPGPLHRLLQRLERWTSHTAALHLVPGRSRYDWDHDRMVVLRNSPLMAELEAARNTSSDRCTDELVLYANGWIGETRGAPVFLDLMTQALSEKLPLRLVIAGRVDGPSALELTTHPMVMYMGEVSQPEALAFYASSDAVLTFYDPSIQVNRQAESNKWGDAVLLRCPIIVNTEVETAGALVEGGAAWSVPYGDTEALIALVRHLVSTPEEISAKRSRLSNFDDLYPIFDTQIAQILSILQDGEGTSC